MQQESAPFKNPLFNLSAIECTDPLIELEKAVTRQGVPEVSGIPSSQSLLVQNFVPISQSIEWQISNWHWQNDGVSSFVVGQVPYIINNSGRLSLQSAKLIYAWMASNNDLTEEITILELGAGTGLFARYLLDNLKRLCDESGNDRFRRIKFYVTDYARTSLDDWQALGIFDDYKEQVVLATCDATKPQQIVLTTGEAIHLSSLHFLFCNYMLDVLPATMLKQVNDQWHELVMSTHLNSGQIEAGQEEILKDFKTMLENGEMPDASYLQQLRQALDFKTNYVPLRNALLTYLESLPEGTEDGDRFLLNFGALESLEKLLNLLHPKGAILINDYGPTQPEHIQDFAAFSSFGATLATGLNFLHLQPYFEFAGYLVDTPENTEKASVQNRLLGHPECSDLSPHFQRCFGEESELYYQQPIEDARRAMAMENKVDTLEYYYQALAINPHDWSVMTEIADYLIMQVEDFDTGLSLAKAALKINPWYSPWAWNVLGDGYYCQDKIELAHQAYLQAKQISASDPRTNLNLAYTHLRRQEYQDALQAVALGLAHDTDSEFRIKLLEKQQQILSAISDQYQAKQQALESRNRRLCE